MGPARGTRGTRVPGAVAGGNADPPPLPDLRSPGATPLRRGARRAWRAPGGRPAPPASGRGTRVHPPFRHPPETGPLPPSPGGTLRAKYLLAGGVRAPFQGGALGSKKPWGGDGSERWGVDWPGGASLPQALRLTGCGIPGPKGPWVRGVRVPQGAEPPVPPAPREERGAHEAGRAKLSLCPNYPQKLGPSRGGAATHAS